MRSLLNRLLALFRGPLLIYLGASVLARAGSIILIPLYTRRLSVEAYGDYALAQTLVAILPTVFTLGLASAIFRFFYAGDDAESRERTASLVSWLVALSLGAGAAAEVLALALGQSGATLRGRWELSCIVIASVGSAIASVPHVYLRAEGRPLAAAAFQLGQFGANASSGLILVAVLDRGLRGVIESMALSAALLGGASLVFILKRLRGRLDRTVLKEALQFSIPFIPHLLASWMMGSTDRWTMKGVGLERDLGGYSLASTLVTPANMVVTAFADADNPRQGAAFRERGLDGLRALLTRTRISYVLATIVPAVALVASVPLIAILIGKDFVPALKLVPFLLVASVMDALYYPSANFIYYTSKTRFVPIATGTGALVSLGLNLVLVPFMGVRGAIAARIAGAAARTAVMTLAARSLMRAQPASGLTDAAAPAASAEETAAVAADASEPTTSDEAP